MVGIYRLINVRQRLRLNPLGGIHDEQRTLNSLHRAAHLISEVHVSGRVDEVQNVGLAVFRRILDPHRVGLNRNATLALDIHGVEHLLLHVAFSYGSGQLDKPVGKRRLTVVNVCHD